MLLTIEKHFIEFMHYIATGPQFSSHYQNCGIQKQSRQLEDLNLRQTRKSITIHTIGYIFQLLMFRVGISIEISYCRLSNCTSKIEIINSDIFRWMCCQGFHWLLSILISHSHLLHKYTVSIIVLINIVSKLILQISYISA